METLLETQGDWRIKPFLSWSSWWSYHLHAEVLWLPEVRGFLSEIGRLLADHEIDMEEAQTEIAHAVCAHCKRLGIPPEHVSYRDIASLALYEELRERAIQAQWAKACCELRREEQVVGDGQLSLFLF